MTYSATHATFTIERLYQASVERVFAAFSDPEQMKRWWHGPDEWDSTPLALDFRVGGGGSSSGGPKGGVQHRFDSRYYDIVPNARIVYSYEMHLDERKISVSLATLEFRPQGRGCKLVLTEQGVFLDGFDDAGGREQGTRALLSQVAALIE